MVIPLYYKRLRFVQDVFAAGPVLNFPGGIIRPWKERQPTSGSGVFSGYTAYQFSPRISKCARA